MGRKDKHKLGQTRNNPVFRVAGAKASRVAKNRAQPQEVTSRLKKIGNGRRSKDIVADAVKDLDAKMVDLRQGPNKKKTPEAAGPTPTVPMRDSLARTRPEVTESDMSSMVESFTSTITAESRHQEPANDRETPDG